MSPKGDILAVGRCLVGAVRASAAIEIFGRDRYAPDAIREPKEVDDEFLRSAFREGVLLIRVCNQILGEGDFQGEDEIRIRIPMGWSPSSADDDNTSQNCLIHWNDGDERTREQVMAAIKGGIQDALTKPVTEVVIGDEPVPLELPEPAPERVAEPDKEPVPA